MTEEVTIELKKILYDPLNQDKPLRDPAELNETMDELSKLTQKEAYDKAPEITVGILLGKLLTEGVQPKDVKQQSKLYRMGKKITKEMATDKGEWKIDEEKLKELKTTLESVKGRWATPKYLGQIFDMLETLTDQLDAKKKEADNK